MENKLEKKKVKEITKETFVKKDLSREKAEEKTQTREHSTTPPAPSTSSILPPTPPPRKRRLHESAAWPDPLAAVEDGAIVDDISRLNPTSVRPPNSKFSSFASFLVLIFSPIVFDFDFPLK